jgi:hypothetical protein
MYMANIDPNQTTDPHLTESLTIHNSVTNLTTIDFNIFHKLGFQAVNMWANKVELKLHPTWITWIKLAWAGLHASQPATEIMDIMKITSLYEYIEQMSQYPPLTLLLFNGITIIQLLHTIIHLTMLHSNQSPMWLQNTL